MAKGVTLHTVLSQERAGQLRKLAIDLDMSMSSLLALILTMGYPKVAALVDKPRSEQKRIVNEFTDHVQEVALQER